MNGEPQNIQQRKEEFETDFRTKLGSFMQAHGVDTVHDLRTKLEQLARGKRYTEILTDLDKKDVLFAMHTDRAVAFLTQSEMRDFGVCAGIVFNARTQLLKNREKPSKPAGKTQKPPDRTETQENIPLAMAEFMKAHGVNNLINLYNKLDNLLALKNYRKIFLISGEDLSIQDINDAIYKVFFLFDSYGRTLKDEEKVDFSYFDMCLRILFNARVGIRKEWYEKNDPEGKMSKPKEQEKQSLGIKRDTALNYEFLVFENPHSDKQTEFPFERYEDRGSFFIFWGLRPYRERDCVCDKKFKCINMYDRIFALDGGKVLVGEKDDGDKVEQFLISSNNGKKIKIGGGKGGYEHIYIFGDWIVRDTHERRKNKPKIQKIMSLEDYSKN